MGYYYKEYKKSPRTLPILGNVGHKVLPFRLTNQDGATITNEDVDGKIRIVEYFFATCDGICPKMNENLSRVYDKFKRDKNIVFMSHTVDPETDTPEKLKSYAAQFDADPERWMFLTGPRDSLYRLALDSYLVTAKEAEDSLGNKLPDFIHSEFFILVDKYGNLRGSYDGTVWKEVKKLMGDIKTLQQEKR